MGTALLLLGGYFLWGFFFAVPFAFAGAQRIDPHAAGAGWGFRLMIIPGAVCVWPLLLLRWYRAIKQPPAAGASEHPAAKEITP